MSNFGNLHTIEMSIQKSRAKISGCVNTIEMSVAGLEDESRLTGGDKDRLLKNIRESIATIREESGN